MAAIEFAITHKAPNEWVLSRWVPARWFSGGNLYRSPHWDFVAMARTEADIMALLKEHSTHRETTKFYDKHGGEYVGDGW